MTENHNFYIILALVGLFFIWSIVLFNYYLKISNQNIELGKSVKGLEKKNGREQKQIDELEKKHLDNQLKIVELQNKIIELQARAINQEKNNLEQRRNEDNSRESLRKG